MASNCETHESSFPASATKIQKYLSVGNLRAKKIIYRRTDPLHILTVGLRQTKKFLRTAIHFRYRKQSAEFNGDA